MLADMRRASVRRGRCASTPDEAEAHRRLMGVRCCCHKFVSAPAPSASASPRDSAYVHIHTSTASSSTLNVGSCLHDRDAASSGAPELRIELGRAARQVHRPHSAAVPAPARQRSPETLTLSPAVRRPGRARGPCGSAPASAGGKGRPRAPARAWPAARCSARPSRRPWPRCVAASSPRGSASRPGCSTARC